MSFKRLTAMSWVPGMLVLLLLLFPPVPAGSAAVCGGVCGDGIVNAGEGCDDGNLLPGDGCDASCQECFDLTAEPPVVSNLAGHPRDMAAADLNNDGITDLLVTTFRPAYLYTYLVQADGSLTEAGRYDLGSNTIMMDVGHLNGDHFVDAVTADGDTDQLHVFFGNGDGTMELANIFLPGDRPRSVQVGDIDTDGYDDLIVGAMWSEGFQIFYGDGAGNFPRLQFISGNGFEAIDSEISDLNGDGYNDLVLCNAAPGMRIYLGGAGGLTRSQDFPIGIVTAHALDLNRDGYPDLVGYGCPGGRATCTRSLSLYAFLNQGDGTFVLTHELNTGQEGWMSKTGDLNNDGVPDLAIVLRGASAVRIFVGDGQGWFQSERDYPMPSHTDGVAILDLNQDGTPEVMVTPYYTSSHREVVPVFNYNYYQFPVCGDGRIGRGESCDDGNRANGDGCSSVCRLEVSADADHDGLSNNQENVLYHTNPLNPDTDGDCVFDGDEVCAGKDPLDPSDQAGCQEIVAPEGQWRVQVTLLEASAGLSSDVWLAEPARERLIRNTLRNVGKVATTEVFSGEEVVLFIRVNAESWGLGIYDHYSDSVFARVRRDDAYHYTVSFEDLPVDRADWDYNDVVLLVEFLPETPAEGVSRNGLDEFQAVQIADPANPATVSLGFDGDAEVTLPAGALSNRAGLMLTAGLPELYGELAAPNFQPVGVYYKVSLTNGQTALAGTEPATLQVSYVDADQNGLLDGTGVLEDSLVFYRFDEERGTWVELDTQVDLAKNQAIGSTSHFSLFALGVPLDRPARGGGGGGGGGDDDSANHSGAFGAANAGNWFGCSFAPAAGPAAGPANLAALFLGVALPLLAVRLARGRKKG